MLGGGVDGDEVVVAVEAVVELGVVGLNLVHVAVEGDGESAVGAFEDVLVAVDGDDELGVGDEESVAVAHDIEIGALSLDGVPGVVACDVHLCLLIIVYKESLSQKEKVPKISRVVITIPCRDRYDESDS